MELLKGDIANDAFSELRISGLTVNPTPEDNRLAIRKLEALAAEYVARNINLNYNFEEFPDPGSPSGIPLHLSNAVSICLAERMLTDFGKGMQPDPTLMKSYSAAVSYLSSVTASINKALPPARFPRGSGNNRGWSRHVNFNRTVQQAPNSANTNQMWIGDVNDFKEDYSSVLSTAEGIATYTIISDSGLEIVSDSLSTPIVSYRIEAKGNTYLDYTTRNYQRVTIQIETTEGRKLTRYINFDVQESA